jgi:hypothetical protein
MQETDYFDAGDVEAGDGEEVAMELVQLELALALEAGSSVVAELPAGGALASEAAVQLEHVQAVQVASFVLALALGDPVVAEAKNASFVVKADVEIVEEGRQLDSKSAVEAVQESEEKTGQAAPTNVADQHVPTENFPVHQHFVTNQNRYAKQEATVSPTVQPSPVPKQTFPPMKGNDVV